MNVTRPATTSMARTIKRIFFIFGACSQGFRLQSLRKRLRFGSRRYKMPARDPNFFRRSVCDPRSRELRTGEVLCPRAKEGLEELYLFLGRKPPLACLIDRRISCDFRPEPDNFAAHPPSNPQSTPSGVLLRAVETRRIG